MNIAKSQLWKTLLEEAEKEGQAEPVLKGIFDSAICHHRSFENALSYHLSSKLACSCVHWTAILSTMMSAHQADSTIADAAVADLQAVRERDPACINYLTPFLFFKGYQAIQSFRVAHYLWNSQRKMLALYFQSRISEIFGVDIHPAAKIGSGILIDHATSVVIGETAVIEDDVTIFHEVTLGGTGKETGDRHPKVRRGVLISAGAKLFGNIEIGKGAKVGGGSVVLREVAPHTTVAGVPARPVGKPREEQPAKAMDQQIEEEH